VSVDKNSGPVLTRLWAKVNETLRTFQSTCPIVYVTFRSADIRH